MAPVQVNALPVDALDGAAEWGRQPRTVVLTRLDRDRLGEIRALRTTDTAARPWGRRHHG